MSLQITEPKQQDPLLNAMGDILHELRRQRVKDDLWTVDDIASYLSLRKSTVQQRVLGKNGFPSPRLLPTTEEGGSQRWEPEEVRQWYKKCPRFDRTEAKRVKIASREL